MQNPKILLLVSTAHPFKIAKWQVSPPKTALGDTPITQIAKHAGQASDYMTGFSFASLLPTSGFQSMKMPSDSSRISQISSYDVGLVIISAPSFCRLSHITPSVLVQALDTYKVLWTILSTHLPLTDCCFNELEGSGIGIEPWVFQGHGRLVK
jgi:hypothetical protein